MTSTTPNLTWIANYIWGIADDVLRNVYVRGKYRDVILPMTVLRRLDAVLEPTKQAVLDMKASRDEMGITDQKIPLRQAAGQVFYNTSKFTLHDLRARANQQRLRADFEDYLDGFSPTEEAGEPFTPRDAVEIMAKLVFLPVAGEIDDGSYLLYDGACGTGGMLPVAEDVVQQLAGQRDKQVSTHLFGQEINAETELSVDRVLELPVPTGKGSDRGRCRMPATPHGNEVDGDAALGSSVVSREAPDFVWRLSS